MQRKPLGVADHAPGPAAAMPPCGGPPKLEENGSKRPKTKRDSSSPIDADPHTPSVNGDASVPEGADWAAGTWGGGGDPDHGAAAIAAGPVPPGSPPALAPSSLSSPSSIIEGLIYSLLSLKDQAAAMRGGAAEEGAPIPQVLMRENPFDLARGTTG